MGDFIDMGYPEPKPVSKTTVIHKEISVDEYAEMYHNKKLTEICNKILAYQYSDRSNYQSVIRQVLLLITKEK